MNKNISAFICCLFFFFPIAFSQSLQLADYKPRPAKKERMAMIDLCCFNYTAMQKVERMGEMVRMV